MALIFNPQDIPVSAVDAHLPAIPRGELTAEALRKRFAVPPVWQPEFVNERRINERVPLEASVLIALVQRDELTVLLTRRADHLHDHPGQISFPGGRTEPEDANACATAIREAREEVGLRQEAVEVLGSLPTYATGTGFIVTPVVALVDANFAVSADPLEVSEVFEVPLQFLANPRHHHHHSADWGGRRREFISMHWEHRGADGQPRSYFIWGATAAMLRNFYRFLAA